MPSSRRGFLGLAAGLGAMAATRARAADTPGVTATEIKIGNLEAYSGPASAYGTIGHFETAFFKMVNEQGGIAGRKINFISLDDGYSPPRSVEATRRLVEQEEVAFIFNPLGTPTVTATEKYMNAKKVPQLFVATGADKWGDYKQFSWTIGWQPSYRIEAQIYAKYILRTKPDAKVGILYQNDDFGKDYVQGFRDVFDDRFDRIVVKMVSYEVTDATIDSQAVSLQNAGVDTLLEATTPKFAAQIIRKVSDLGWKPTQFLTNVSISAASVMIPAGPEKGIGVISAAYAKDPSDPTWKDDAGLRQYLDFMKQRMPDANVADTNYIYGMGVCLTLMQVLKQCGGDFSRANIMKQATDLHDFVSPTFLPGIRINTSPTDYHPIRQMQLQRWDGKSWSLFGSIIEGSGS